MSDCRHSADADPNQAILVDTMKLLGNSGYGKTIASKSAYTNFSFCDGIEVHRINGARFRRVDQLDKDIFEVKEFKGRVVKTCPCR